MFRILFLILAVAAFILAANWISSQSGMIVTDFAGNHISTNVSTLIGMVFVMVVLIILVTLMVYYFVSMPKRLSQRNHRVRQEKGLTALTRGLEAVAAGDAKSALDYAGRASKQLDAPALTRLLNAQAAQLAGNDELAEGNFIEMLEAPETEFLGLRGLYMQAIKADDKHAARAYAERAFQLRPNAPFAFNTVFHLAIERHAWSEALEYLRMAVKSGHDKTEEDKRAKAALLTANAYAARQSEDYKTAHKEAKQALEVVPYFVPAIALQAELYDLNGKQKKAVALLNEAWAVAPHISYLSMIKDFHADAGAERQSHFLKELAATNATHPLSNQAEANAALLAHDYEKVVASLETELAHNPSAESLKLMAKAVEAMHGDEKSKAWYDKAADAPNATEPTHYKQFNFTADEWETLIIEFMRYARLAPPPLHVVDTSVDEAEIQLLLAPPPEEEVSEAADIIEETDKEEIIDVEPVDATPPKDYA